MSDTAVDYDFDCNRNLVLSDDPGRVRSQIISVVYQIQRFYSHCNLVLTRKVIIRTSPGLGLNPLCTCTKFSMRAAAAADSSSSTLVRPREARCVRAGAADHNKCVVCRASAHALEACLQAQGRIRHSEEHD